MIVGCSYRDGCLIDTAYFAKNKELEQGTVQHDNIHAFTEDVSGSDSKKFPANANISRINK